MICSMAKKRMWLGTHWEMLGVTVVLFVLVAVFVDLKPAVDENFFFSTSDPGVRESKKVEQRDRFSREQGSRETDQAD